MEKGRSYGVFDEQNINTHYLTPTIFATIRHKKAARFFLAVNYYKRFILLIQLRWQNGIRFPKRSLCILLRIQLVFCAGTLYDTERPA